MPLCWGVEAALTGWFKTTRPCEMNDPFECLGCVCGQVPRAVYEEYIHANYDEIKRQLQQRDMMLGIGPHDYSEQNVFDAYYPRHVKVFENQVIMRESYNEIGSFICFVDHNGLSDEAQRLMWAHYADGGKGVRIEFEFNEDNDCSAYVFQRVKYAEKPPTCDLCAVDHWPKCDSIYKFLIECLLTKSLEWAYENEVRMIISKRMAKGLIRTMPRGDGGLIELVYLRPEMIVGITFGVRVCDSDINAVQEAFSEVRETSAHFFKRMVHSDKSRYSVRESLV